MIARTAFTSARLDPTEYPRKSSRSLLMSAPFVGLVGCTPIVQRKRADAQQQQAAQSSVIRAYPRSFLDVSTSVSAFVRGASHRARALAGHIKEGMFFGFDMPLVLARANW